MNRRNILRKIGAAGIGSSVVAVGTTAAANACEEDLQKGDRIEVDTTHCGKQPPIGSITVYEDTDHCHDATTAVGNAHDGDQGEIIEMCHTVGDHYYAKIKWDTGTSPDWYDHSPSWASVTPSLKRID